MALVDLIMPQLGEGIMEATVLNWLKKVGERVEEEGPVVEIATDKVDSEVPSPVAGTIKETFYKENDIVKIGAVLAKIETDEETVDDSLVQVEKDTTENEQETIIKELNQEIPIPENTENKVSSTSENNSGFYSPLVINIAREEGITPGELENIPGTGKEKRLTKNDILHYIERKKSGNIKEFISNEKHVLENTSQQKEAESAEQNINTSGNTEIVEMDRMRKMIARHMKDSQNISATVTSFAEADVTNMVIWRNNIKKEFEKRENTKITFTPMFIECVASVLRRYPMLNSSVDGDKIIIKKDINIGMATALPNGNLIVPVIKNADNLNLVGLAKRVNELADRARNNKLQPADTQLGTFSVTNVGGFGSITGTPVINQPQVAILALGTIKKRPMVLETKDGDVIAIRHMMILALSYDHRIIDGSLGSRFLADVVKAFEEWEESKY